MGCLPEKGSTVEALDVILKAVFSFVNPLRNACCSTDATESNRPVGADEIKAVHFLKSSTRIEGTTAKQRRKTTISKWSPRIPK